MYLFSPSTSQCQEISNFYQYAYGQLKLSDTTLFMLGYDPSSYNLHLYKHTFGNTSPDWSLKQLWISGSWAESLSESVLVSSSIYTFFSYGSTQYAYMAVISISDGSVSTRYKSSDSCDNIYIYGSGVSGNYIAVNLRCSSYHLLMFNVATNLFIIKAFSGDLKGIGLEPITNR